MFSVNGVKAPADWFEEPAWKLGAKGSGPAGHGPPPGPEVIWKAGALRSTDAAPDHGVKAAVVA